MTTVNFRAKSYLAMSEQAIGPLLRLFQPLDSGVVYAAQRNRFRPACPRLLLLSQLRIALPQPVPGYNNPGKKPRIRFIQRDGFCPATVFLQRLTGAQEDHVIFKVKPGS